MEPNGRIPTNRRYFIGGSDARIIIGDDEAALRIKEVEADRARF